MMSEQGTPAEQAPAVEQTATPAAPQTEQPGTPPDPLAAVQSRLDEFGQSTQSFQDEMRQFMASQQQDPYAEYEDPNQQDPGFDPTDPQQAQQYINQQVQAALYPQQMEQLVNRYPDLRTDPQIQQAVVGGLQQLGLDPRGMVDPRMVEMVYKAHKADQIAAQQTPVADNPPPQLDPAGASQQQPQPDLADMIRQAAPGMSSFLTPPRQ